MHVEPQPGGAAAAYPGRVAGGPLPLTMRQSAIAAVVVLVVGLGVALLTPLAAAVEARRHTPPGAVVAGQATILPADGWIVEEKTTNAVLLNDAGARMLVQWRAGAPPDAQTALSSLAQATTGSAPDAVRFGGARQFTTPTGDTGYLEPFAAPGSTGAIAVVLSSQGEATVQALAPSTTFSQVADEIVSMITGLRIRRGSGT